METTITSNHSKKTVRKEKSNAISTPQFWNDLEDICKAILGFAVDEIKLEIKYIL